VNGDAEWKLNLRVEEAKQETLDAITQGIGQVFEIEIRSDAVENSPYKTGHNRRMIGTDVSRSPGKIIARLFSQSGYGGFLELGTRFMKARPYLWPAFNKHINLLKEIIGSKVRSIKPAMFIGPRKG
jgi:HK97 gp10 family phage protein